LNIFDNIHFSRNKRFQELYTKFEIHNEIWQIFMSIKKIIDTNVKVNAESSTQNPIYITKG